MDYIEDINELLAEQEQPQVSDEEIEEIENLANERQLEIELELELEKYAIEQMMKEN